MPVVVSRVVDHQIYETLPGKEIVYVLPVTSILGRLPVSSRSAIVMDATTAPIAMTMPLPTLTPVLVLASVNSWVLGW